MKIGYARVSTTDQSCNLQIDALRLAGCEKIYVEQGVSGSKKKRPELDKMLSEVSSGDTIVTWRIDRLGRSFVHLLSLIEDFKEKGIRFESLTEKLDMDSMMGVLIFRILSSIAEYEREGIRERVRAGKRAALARGSKQGPKFKYGANPDRKECSRATWYRRQQKEATK